MNDFVRGYKRGSAFPNEAFVQAAIEKHFRSSGYERVVAAHSDYACHHPSTGDRWVIEAKGATSAIGLDFRTGLGQLVQRASEPTVRYALVVPNMPKFLTQCSQVSAWVRESLGIYWLIVSEDSSIRVVSPKEHL
jgi:hypothetical protein